VTALAYFLGFLAYLPAAAALGADSFEERLAAQTKLKAPLARYAVRAARVLARDPEVEYRCGELLGWEFTPDPFALPGVTRCLYHKDFWCDQKDGLWLLADPARQRTMAWLLKATGTGDADEVVGFPFGDGVGMICGYMNVMRARARGCPLPRPLDPRGPPMPCLPPEPVGPPAPMPREKK
jgi:hypothetical protein